MSGNNVKFTITTTDGKSVEKTIQVMDGEQGPQGPQGVPGSTMVRHTSSGNFSFGYPDTPGAANACGFLDDNDDLIPYWKSRVELDGAVSGDVNIMIRVWLQNVPYTLEEDKKGFPNYQIFAEYVTAQSGQQPYVDVWLLVYGKPTAIYNIIEKTITNLARSADSENTGLPYIPVGDPVVEFHYSMEYFINQAVSS